MRETTIARFLAGEATAEELERDDRGAGLIDDVDVTPEMLLRLLDAELSMETRQAVANAILESDRFVWVEDAIAGALYDVVMRRDLAKARRWLVSSPAEEEEEWGKPPIRRSIFILAASAGGGLILFGLLSFAMTRQSLSALPMIIGLLLLLRLQASYRSREEAGLYRAALLICAGICLVSNAIVFVGNHVQGPRFIDGAFGENLFIFGMAFFAIAFVLMFMQAAYRKRR